MGDIRRVMYKELVFAQDKLGDEQFRQECDEPRETNPSGTGRRQYKSQAFYARWWPQDPRLAEYLSLVSPEDLRSGILNDEDCIRVLSCVFSRNGLHTPRGTARSGGECCSKALFEDLERRCGGYGQEIPLNEKGFLYVEATLLYWKKACLPAP